MRSSSPSARTGRAQPHRIDMPSTTSTPSTSFLSNCSRPVSDSSLLPHPPPLARTDCAAAIPRALPCPFIPPSSAAPRDAPVRLWGDPQDEQRLHEKLVLAGVIGRSLNQQQDPPIVLRAGADMELGVERTRDLLGEELAEVRPMIRRTDVDAAVQVMLEHLTDGLKPLPASRDVQGETAFSAAHPGHPWPGVGRGTGLRHPSRAAINSKKACLAAREAQRIKGHDASVRIMKSQLDGIRRLNSGRCHGAADRWRRVSLAGSRSARRQTTAVCKPFVSNPRCTAS
jgi:hypothetical protein